MLEAVGFWILFTSLALLLCIALASENILGLERRIPFCIQFFGAPIAAMIMFIGWHIMNLGNQGRYPGYPLDIIIEWLR